MNCCLHVARIGKRVTRDRQHLAERSPQTMDYRILIASCSWPARVEDQQTLGRSEAQFEFRELAAFSQPDRERARESGLASSWRTEQLDDHAPPLLTAPKSGARFRA